jgi:predicted nucleotidyltransferase
MCKVGDIILIKKYKSGKHTLSQHSFVVLSDDAGQIKGMNYDIVCNVMSSFKNEQQKQDKLSYPGNFPIAHDDSIVKNDNGINGYIKTEQLYYFNKSNIDFIVIGQMKQDIFDLLIEFITTELNTPIIEITENL